MEENDANRFVECDIMNSEEAISTNGSLDCCSKIQIEKNKKDNLECSICHNTGYLYPRTQKEKEDYKEGYSQALEDVEKELKKWTNYKIKLLKSFEPCLTKGATVKLDLLLDFESLINAVINEKKASHNIDCTNSEESDKT